MFPTLRLILAGVSALFLVTLGALSLTDTSVDRMPARVATASFAPRGAMIDRNNHPEWQPFLLQAALRRADELSRLRDLPDQPDPNAVAFQLASLPLDPRDQAPNDIVEPSAELPAPSAPETVPAVEIKMEPDITASVKPVAESRPAAAKKKPVRKIVRRSKPTQPATPANPFATLFGNTSTASTSAAQ